MSPPHLTVETAPASADVAFLDERLYEFNVARTGLADGTLLAVFVREDDGAIGAGLYGSTWGACCEVRYLWVREDRRGQGLGSRLLAAAEAEAVRRGCVQVVLDTHDFQAPAFYRKRGYGIVAVVPGYPRGHDRIHLQKRLQDRIGTTLLTPRLRLRPWTPADVEPLHRLWTDGAVRRYLWDDLVITRAQAAATVADSVASFAAHGYGSWLVSERGTGARVGFAGLRRVGDEVEVLYGLAPAAWGRGYATEATAAVLRFAVEQCGLPRLVGRTDPGNAASVRVLERLGLRYERTEAGPAGPLLCYAVAAAGGSSVAG